MLIVIITAATAIRSFVLISVHTIIIVVTVVVMFINISSFKAFKSLEVIIQDSKQILRNIVAIQTMIIITIIATTTTTTFIAITATAIELIALAIILAN